MFRAKKTDLFTQAIGDETLIYDRRSDACHQLSPQAALVWQELQDACTEDSLVASLLGKFPELGDGARPYVRVVLSDLASKELLADGVATSGLTATRRGVLKSLGLTTIATVLAPLPAAAGSNTLVITEARYFNNTVDAPNTVALCGVAAPGVCPGTNFTAQLNALITGNSVSLLCSNGTITGGDPCTGIIKECRVRYTCGASPVQILRFCEGATINVSC